MFSTNITGPMPKPGIVIGLPFCKRPVMPEWAICLATQNWPLNTSIMYAPFRDVDEQGNVSPIAVQRNKIAQLAIEKDAPYLLFIDDDVELPPWGGRQLMATMKQAAEDVMVVAGIYFARSEPTEPIVYRGVTEGAFWKWKKNTIFEVDGIGTGCMLINTKVFEKIEYPWFADVDLCQNEVPDRDGSVKMSDDLYFCKKVKEAGFKILADSHVMCRHWDVNQGIAFRCPDDAYPLVRS